MQVSFNWCYINIVVIDYLKILIVFGNAAEFTATVAIGFNCNVEKFTYALEADMLRPHREDTNTSKLGRLATSLRQVMGQT